MFSKLNKSTFLRLKTIFLLWVFEGLQRGSETTRFIIISAPRSGSNLLCGMLNFHPEIICHHEIFHPDRIWYSKNFHEFLGIYDINLRDRMTKGELGLGSKKSRDLFPEYFLFKIWKSTFGRKAIGFKVFASHAPFLTNALVSNQNVKKIILYRENKIAAYTSKLWAEQTDTWNITDKEKNTKDQFENKKLHIDLEKFFLYAHGEITYFKSLQRSCIFERQNFFEISYEQLTGKEHLKYRKNLLNFIGVNPDASLLKEMFVKQSSKPIQAQIKNFREVKTALEASKWGHWIK